MNDIEKTEIKRKNSGKRMRRRKRMNSLYVFVVFVLVATIGITMCFTFLFNIDSVVISGESENYTYMEIVEASGIRIGDNLFRLDTKKAEQNILDELLYVETASVNKDFPSTLRINVTRCIPAYNVKKDVEKDKDGTVKEEERVLLVSRKGKILSINDYYTNTDELPVIYGFDPLAPESGKALVSKSDNKLTAFGQIMESADKDNTIPIASVDLTNEYNIVVHYRNGIIFKMGNWNDVGYKLDLAQNVMNQESVRGKTGYLMMVGSNQCSFRSTGELEPETSEETTAVTSTAPANNDAIEVPYEPDFGYDDNNYYDDGVYYDDGNYYDGGGYYDDGGYYDGGVYDDFGNEFIAE